MFIEAQVLQSHFVIKKSIDHDSSLNARLRDVCSKFDLFAFVVALICCENCDFRVFEATK